MFFLSHRRLAWLLAAGLLCLSALACSLVTPATPTPQPTATSTPTATPTNTPLPPTPTQTPTPTATDTPTPLPPTETPIPTDTPTNTLTPTPTIRFVTVEIEPSQGTLADLLREHAAVANTLGLTAYVEFTATWCPACQAIKESLDDDNELMMDAFQGTYIIPVDVDIWTEDDWVDAGFEIEFIPIYFEIDETGQPTGDNIGGDAWGENIPANMAPPLKEFFQAHAAHAAAR